MFQKVIIFLMFAWSGIALAADISLTGSKEIATLCSRTGTDQVIGGFAVGNGSTFLKVWDVKKGKQQEGSFKVAAYKPRFVSSVDGAKLFIIADQRKTVFDHDIQDYVFVGTDRVYVAYPDDKFAYHGVIESSAEIKAIAPHPQETNLYAVAHGKSVDICDVEKEDELRTFAMKPDHQVGGVCLSPRGTKVACTDSYPMDHAVRVFDMETGKQLLESRKHQKMQLIGLGVIYYNPDGQEIVSQGSHEVIVQDVRSPQAIISKVTSSVPVESLSVYSRDHLFAMRSDDGQLRLFAWGYNKPMMLIEKTGAFCFNQEGLVHTYDDSSSSIGQIISPRTKVAQLPHMEQIAILGKALRPTAQAQKKSSQSDQDDAGSH